MLAKIWKKLLLAICIIACIFNVMLKLVNRTSLEVNLESVQHGESLVETLKTNNTNSIIESAENTTVETQMTDEAESSNEEAMKQSKDIEEIEENKQTDFVVIY